MSKKANKKNGTSNNINQSSAVSNQKSTVVPVVSNTSVQNNLNQKFPPTLVQKRPPSMVNRRYREFLEDDGSHGSYWR